VGNTQNASFVACFVDKIAHAAGQAPYQLRRKLLSNKPKMQAVLDLAAEKAGWGKPKARQHVEK
jgi:isoquinoline 1-oxidoreductase beta subunit